MTNELLVVPEYSNKTLKWLSEVNIYRDGVHIANSKRPYYLAVQKKLEIKSRTSTRLINRIISSIQLKLSTRHPEISQSEKANLTKKLKELKRHPSINSTYTRAEKRLNKKQSAFYSGYFTAIEGSAYEYISRFIGIDKRNEIRDRFKRFFKSGVDTYVIENYVMHITYEELNESIISFLEQSGIPKKKIDKLKELFSTSSQGLEYEDYLTKKAKYLLSLDYDFIEKQLRNEVETNGRRIS